jgi:hypothetical protein
MCAQGFAIHNPQARMGDATATTREAPTSGASENGGPTYNDGATWCQESCHQGYTQEEPEYSLTIQEDYCGGECQGVAMCIHI